ncbi:hypothetical protein BCR43DRAFT_362317 [Syncephalastrum racemosum]|uniref:C3H1-type domain-containing protein n=1 Tax=Syncephalastrum racemosum TaxID=13706 RepID=A0A1X2H3Q8_SYNRA|nr:hypothetical protein BCR43DRAFT_362317 [Syncephalastrum racemosum]
MSDAELRARIARLSGAIEQHRTTANQYSSRGRGYYSPVRARGRGHYAAVPGRNMTLNNTKTSGTAAAPTTYSPPTTVASTPSTSYKASPHRTLVNTQASSSTVPNNTQTSTVTTPRKVVIDGVTFTVKGRKLVREGVSPLPAAIKRGTHVLVRKSDKNKNRVAGSVPILKRKTRPVRSKVGNMVLKREPEGYTRQGLSGKSLVLTSTQRNNNQAHCGIYTRYGRCPRGPTCAFKHDPAHRAICPRFLQNRCKRGAACQLSHTPTPHIMPHCAFFQKGGFCSNEACPYPHVRVSTQAPVCRAFAMQGYCAKGLQCHNKHIHVCPEFAETGKCSNANCRMPHVTRRNNGQGKTEAVVLPSKWMSSAYVRAQKKSQHEEQARQRAKIEEQRRQRQWVRPTTNDEKEATMETGHTRSDTGEQEGRKEEDGFVPLFDSDEDDDDAGWGQYWRGDSQSDATPREEEEETLRFSDKDEDEDEEEDEQYEEEEAPEPAYGSVEEEDYTMDEDGNLQDFDEYEIAEEE